MHAAISEVPTPYRVVCRENPIGGPGCGGFFLTSEEYTRQMFNANKTWQCPNCGGYDAVWDDENYEAWYEDPPEPEADDYEAPKDWAERMAEEYDDIDR